MQRIKPIFSVVSSQLQKPVPNDPAMKESRQNAHETVGY